MVVLKKCLLHHLDSRLKKSKITILKTREMGIKRQTAKRMKELTKVEKETSIQMLTYHKLHKIM